MSGSSEPQGQTPEFDVFLSYHAADRSAVEVLAGDLRQRGLRVWFDQWAIVPGETWQDALAKGIHGSRTVAVCVGPSGIGPWEQSEAQLALDAAFHRPGYRIIPIRLAGAPPWSEVRGPVFLRLFSGIEFRDGTRDPEALRRLVSGIQGQSPGPPEPFSLLENSIPPGQAGLRHHATQTGLADCLSSLGVPADACGPMLEWLLETCGPGIEAGSPIFPDVRSWMREAGVANGREHRTEEFLHAWIMAMSPAQLLYNAFYFSRNKVTRVFKAHRQHIVHHFRNSPTPTADFSPEDKYQSVYRYFFETGNLVFLPAREVLGQSMPWGADPVFYFIGAFCLNRPEEVRSAFSEFDTLSASVGLANYVFRHPDPLLYPYISLSGNLGPHQVSMLLSRKYFAINSMTVDELHRLLLRNTQVIAGYGSIERTEDGMYEVHPVACHFMRTPF